MEYSLVLTVLLTGCVCLLIPITAQGLGKFLYIFICLYMGNNSVTFRRMPSMGFHRNAFQIFGSIFDTS